MTRKFWLFFSTVILIIMSGCAKKPVPETPPSPMTESWLMQHTKIVPNTAGNSMTITQPSFIQETRFGEGNATVHLTLAVDTHRKDDNRTDKRQEDSYLLLFSMRADRWGNFTSAIDTFGRRHSVKPYTSYIRQGLYYENLFIAIDRAWMESAASEKSTFLLLGPDSEITVVLPPVYPSALMHSFRDYQDGNTTVSPAPKE